MGYHIDYHTVRKKHRGHFLRSGTLSLTALFFLLFLYAVYRFWPAGMQLLQALISAAFYKIALFLGALQNKIMQALPYIS